MIKRQALISFILASLLLASFFVSAGNVFSSSLDELQGQIADADNRKNDIDDELASVNEALEQRRKELEENSRKYSELAKEHDRTATELQKQTEELEELFDEIAALQQTIAEAEQAYAEALDLFFRRAAVLYRYADYTPLQLFTESKNLFTYADRARLLQSILQSDRRDMEELAAMKKDLDAKKAMVEVTSVDLEAMIAEKEAIMEKLENSQTITEEDLQVSRSAIERLEAQEAALLEESERVSANVRALQEQYDKLLAEQQQSNPGATEPDPSGKLLWPAESGTWISSPYGYRFHPISGKWTFHSGIDIPAPGGSNILAAESGTVMTAMGSDSYGNYIVIYHGNGLSTLYAHSSKLLVQEGDMVRRGQVIALVGSTGWSTGNHLHFEVRINGETQNPLDYLP